MKLRSSFKMWPTFCQLISFVFFFYLLSLQHLAAIINEEKSLIRSTVEQERKYKVLQREGKKEEVKSNKTLKDSFSKGLVSTVEWLVRAE